MSGPNDPNNFDAFSNPPEDASINDTPINSTPADSVPPSVSGSHYSDGGQLTNTPPPVSCGTPQQLPGAEKKIAAGICGILLGGLGVHKFILGYNTEGIIMLVVWLLGATFSCLFLPIFASITMNVIGLIEGIVYITKTDQEFVDTYITGKRTWF